MLDFLIPPQPAQPRCVRIKSRQRPPPLGVAVEVSDVKTGALLFACSLSSAAAWLDVGGYRWRTGSDGIWERP